MANGCIDESCTCYVQTVRSENMSQELSGLSATLHDQQYIYSINVQKVCINLKNKHA